VIVDAGRVVLRGAVEEIRAAAHHRYADVEFAGPVTWEPRLDGATVVGRSNNHIRVRTPAAVTPASLLADASAHGDVRSFSFAPPDLSEVFLHTVGRPESTGNGEVDW
jgi:hypothetical protein